MPQKATRKSTKSTRKKATSKVNSNKTKSTKAIANNKKASTGGKRSNLFSSAKSRIGAYFRGINRRRVNYLKRRPHRSFRLTKRRDYSRSFKMPGYFSFTIETFKLMWKNKKTFGLLGICFILLYIIFNLMGKQENYQLFHDTLYGTAPDSLFSGVAGEIGKAGLLLFTSVTQGLGDASATTSDKGQQYLAVFLGLYIWLAIVWILRNIMAGRKVGVRDGLYNAGAPIISTSLLVIVFLVQLIPLAIAIIVTSAAGYSGLLEQGAWAMLATIGLAFVVTISLYWVVSTIIAMVIVTLPGMYPMRALAIAGDLVIGRRLRLVYRFIWMAIVAVSGWVVIMIPIILFDNWIKSVFSSIEWMPIVPLMFLIMSTFTIFWTAAYTYLLYRKMVDDDASPA